MSEAVAAILKADGVRLSLGAREVLRGVSLEVGPGDLVAIAGPNGAGKSTLLRVLAGLARPQGGSVRLGNEDVATIDRRALGRRIAYLPQDRTVHWPLKVRSVVALGRIPHGSGPARGESLADRDMIARALLLTDVQQLADRPISELSGGERARVLIARALAQDASLLVADEPTAGLDPAHALTLFETFTRICSEGRAVVVALHDLSLALRYCPRAVLLKDGEVAASGPTRDVLTEADIGRVYGVTAKIGDVGGVPAVVSVAPRS